ncbi:hypothetical protein LZ32DRAFT_607706 [Colletotrichum eremochloae]|nr:hypothetical protein LZ32DRAFT_607706 [Colletotrichum eremochloae]
MTTEPASQVPLFSNDSAKPYAHICSWLDHIVVDQKPDDDQDVIAVTLRKRHRPLTPVSPDQMDHPSKRHRRTMPDEAVIAKTYHSGSKFTLSIDGRRLNGDVTGLKAVVLMRRSREASLRSLAWARGLLAPPPLENCFWTHRYVRRVRRWRIRSGHGYKDRNCRSVVFRWKKSM